MSWVPTGWGDRSRHLALGVVLIAAALVAVPLVPGSGAQSPQPNVVVVMTDNQSVEWMRVMAGVRRKLAARGSTYSRSYANFPLCCPSRATFLTGQFAHNHGVWDNGGPDGGFQALDSTNTLPVWLQAAGYRTGHVGRYLNGYGSNIPTLVPAGWDEWYAPPDPSNFREYYYDLNENGTLVSYGQSFKGDVLTDKAVDFIRRNGPSPAPFFLSVAYIAPHTSSTGPLDPNCARKLKFPRPAPRHVGAFANEPMPRPPSFNEADVSDKPSAVQNLPPLSLEKIAFITRSYRCSLASLLHVDEGVVRILSQLESVGELSNTLIIFTSDNGMLLGEHRVPRGTVWPYEESVRVPLIIRGPGFAAGATVENPVTNADLAPTILDRTGVQPGLPQDGMSLLDLANTPTWPDRALLVETGPNGVNADNVLNYAGVITSRFAYLEHYTAERELYDLHVDPYQLENREGDPAYASDEAALAARLATLRNCAGAGCSGLP